MNDWIIDFTPTSIKILIDFLKSAYVRKNDDGNVIISNSKIYHGLYNPDDLIENINDVKEKIIKELYKYNAKLIEEKIHGKK